MHHNALTWRNCDTGRYRSAGVTDSGGIVFEVNSVGAVVDDPGQFRTQTRPMNDAINEPMLQQEFTCLEPIRQVDLAGCLNNTRTGKADKSVWFCDNDIAK